MASPASLKHAQLQGFLLATLDFFVSHYDLGIVLGEMSAYQLNEDNVYQPDVSFLSRERLHLAGEVHLIWQLKCCHPAAAVMISSKNASTMRALARANIGS